MQKNNSEKTFEGFSQATITYLNDLRNNNNREWFQEHRKNYDEFFLKPAFAFVNALGGRLSKLVKDLQYEPKIDRSVFRLNRDVRFSKNKQIYKTHMGLVFWKGPFRERQFNPGFYFHLEPEQLFLATGLWMMRPDMLAEYRKALLDKKLGERFLKITDLFSKNGLKADSEDQLKRYPAGFSEENPLAKYSRYKGLYVAQEDIGIPDVVFKEELMDYCLAFYSKTVDFLDWISDVAYRTNYNG